MEPLYTLECVPQKNCLANLPLHLVQKHIHTNPLILRIQNKQFKCALAWSGDTTTHQNIIQIPAQLAIALSLTHNTNKNNSLNKTTVHAQLITLPLATHVHLIPNSFQDYKLVSEQALDLENVLLQQMRLVEAKQKLPLWVDSEQVAWLVVEAIQAENGDQLEEAMLGVGSQLHVAPPRLTPAASLSSTCSDCLISRVVPIPLEFAELAICIHPEAMLELGVSEGDIILIHLVGAWRRDETPIDRSGKLLRERAKLPGHAFAFASCLSSLQYSSGKSGTRKFNEVALGKWLMLQLECEVCDSIVVRRALIGSSSVVSLPAISLLLTPISTLPLAKRTSQDGGREDAPDEKEARHSKLKTDVALWLLSALGRRARSTCQASSNSSGSSSSRGSGVDIGVERHRAVPIAFGAYLPFTYTCDEHGNGEQVRSVVLSSLSAQEPNQLSMAAPLMLDIGDFFLGGGGVTDAVAAVTDAEAAVTDAVAASNLFSESKVLENYLLPPVVPKVNVEMKVLAPMMGLKVDSDSSCVHFAVRGREARDLVGYTRSVLRARKKYRGQTRLSTLLGLLLCGKSGEGKTSLIETAAAMASAPLLSERGSMCAESEVEEDTETVWYGLFDAGMLRASPAKTIIERIQSALHLARRRDPSVLILDNIDHIAPATEAAETSMTSLIAHCCAELLSAFGTGSHRVAIIATAQSPDSVHPALRECGLFDREVELQPLDESQRRSAIRALVEEHRIEACDNALAFLAQNSQRMVLADLKGIVNAAAASAMSRSLCATASEACDKMAAIASIKLLDFQKAMRHIHSLPAQVRNDPGLAEDNNTQLNFGAIGGLEAAKRALFDTVILPSRRPLLFAGAPLRLKSGILLHGPPGCGKTLLVRALAQESRLPMLSVKGPELLSKYIGASETAVRDLFRRAASMMPCIIFFDEFDSLAPRRGADSTGVTDRVVNQLLCMLDGFEEIRNIYIIAASNRPEMIDPALLRPGRIDRRVSCPMPSASECVDILTALCRQRNFNVDALDRESFICFAKKCSGLSGAELCGLVNTAQINAIQQVLDKYSPRQVDSCDSPSLIDAAIADETTLPLWIETHEAWRALLSTSDASHVKTKSTVTPPTINLDHLKSALETFLEARSFTEKGSNGHHLFSGMQVQHSKMEATARSVHA